MSKILVTSLQVLNEVSHVKMFLEASEHIVFISSGEIEEDIYSKLTYYFPTHRVDACEEASLGSTMFEAFKNATEQKRSDIVDMVLSRIGLILTTSGEQSLIIVLLDTIIIDWLRKKEEVLVEKTKISFL